MKKNRTQQNYSMVVSKEMKKKTHVGLPQFSPYHPVIPKLYTPGWKLDMPNRFHIMENCTMAGVVYQPTEASMYWEKRERLDKNGPRKQPNDDGDDDDDDDGIPEREKLLRPPIHSHLSKYQSSLMSRYCYP